MAKAKKGTRKEVSEATKLKRAANLEKARAARKVNLAAKSTEPNKPADPSPAFMPIPEGVKVPEQQVVPDLNESQAIEVDPEKEALRKQVEKLQTQMDTILSINPNINKDEAIDGIAKLQGTHIGPNGVQGQVFRYPVDKNFYPDPSDRLYDDPELKRHAMRENYYFVWNVEGETYEKNNIAYVEPRFTVELWKFLYDEEGKPNNMMGLVNRQFQHEDEFIARVGADRLGLKEGIDYETFQQLMDEMRYQRIRRWLLGCFQTTKIYQGKKMRTMVIDGKQIEVTDVENIVDKDRAIDQSNSIMQSVSL